MNENRTKSENETGYMYELKRKGEEIIVVTASRQRAMKELGRVTFSPDPTSGGGSPRDSLERRVSLERLPREEDSTFKYEMLKRGESEK